MIVIWCPYADAIGTVRMYLDLLVKIIFVIVVLTLDFYLCRMIKTLFGMDKDVAWDTALATVSTSLRGFAESFPMQLLMV